MLLNTGKALISVSDSPSLQQHKRFHYMRIHAQVSVDSEL